MLVQEERRMKEKKQNSQCTMIYKAGSCQYNFQTADTNCLDKVFSGLRKIKNADDSQMKCFLFFKWLDDVTWVHSWQRTVGSRLYPKCVILLYLDCWVEDLSNLSFTNQKGTTANFIYFCTVMLAIKIEYWAKASCLAPCENIQAYTEPACIKYPVLLVLENTSPFSIINTISWLIK